MPNLLRIKDVHFILYIGVAMIRKLIALSCLAVLTLSAAACSGPGDVVTVEPSARTLPGDGSGNMTEGEGMLLTPEK